ncbi:efflux transporter outer membrane subunit [Silvimonas sp.]|uniref:efflux transporter outer membrane subunit n=1 Tax=Silvimonas sp. TaxID=2650811 RepID=UPI00283C32CD|nr:efflux transporter outer membrane subunit [Silvimonas sp.]MDR3426407.1 efflux transporter outer membrane subunit [Silvimonas sp.]
MITKTLRRQVSPRKSQLLLSVLVTALLAGCANWEGLSPQGKVLDANTLGASKSLSGARVDASVWPQQNWWTALGDAQLSSLIDEALKNNPTLEVADARTRVALAQAGQADAARMPRVDAAAAYSGIRIPGTVLPAPFGDGYAALKMVSLKFSYDFDLWGGQRAAWEAAVGQSRATEIDGQQARITLSGNLARTYAQLGYAWQLQDIAKADLQRAQDQLKLVQQRVDAGIDSQVQLKQAQSALPAARQQLESTQQQIDDSQLALAALLGAGPDRGQQLARPQVLQPSALALPSVLPAELVGRRADIVAAKWRVESASKEIKTAQTKFYPDFNLTAAIGLASLGLGNLAEWDSRYGQLGPALTLPIFDGGRLRANLSAKDAQYDLAVAQYNQSLVNAMHEVAAQISALQSLARQVTQQKEAIQTAQQAYELSMQRYHGGLGNYLDVLSIQQQLLNAQMRLAGLNAQQLDASVLLVQALGGGYRPADDTPTLATASAPAQAQ